MHLALGWKDNAGNETGIDAGLAKHVADEARLVGGNLAAGVFDAVPRADSDGGTHFLGMGAGGGRVSVEVEFPCVAGLRAGDDIGKPPWSVAAAAAHIDDGRDVGAAVGAELLGIPQRHHAEDIARNRIEDVSGIDACRFTETSIIPCMEMGLLRNTPATFRVSAG